MTPRHLIPALFALRNLWPPRRRASWARFQRQHADFRLWQQREARRLSDLGASKDAVFHSVYDVGRPLDGWLIRLRAWLRADYMQLDTLRTAQNQGERRRLFIAALLTLAMWLASGLFACAAEKPTLCVWWSIANSNKTEPGSVSPILRTDGWQGYIDKRVKPAIKWCEDSGVTPIIEVHLAFGQWRQEMHLDNLDFARESGCEWIEKDFVRAWAPITAKYECIGYVGSVAFDPALASMPPRSMAKMIRRNVEPFKRAGFAQIAVDHTGDAITHHVSTPGSGRLERSLDAFELNVIDAMGFKKRCAIESAPRRTPEHADLAKRDCWQLESRWRVMFGPWETPSKEKAAIDHGWGARDHLKGRVFRMLRTEYTPQETLAVARKIAADGDIPAVHPADLIAAGIKAGEIFSSSGEGKR